MSFEHTPQFNTVINGRSIDKVNNGIQGHNAEEMKIDERVNRGSFIDLNDESVIYQTKKNFSPILQKRNDDVGDN